MREMWVGRWRGACWISIFAFCLGCNIHVVQSRDEFVSAVRSGQGPTEICEFVVDKPMPRILALLRDRSDTCVELTVRRSGVAGGVRSTRCKSTSLRGPWVRTSTPRVGFTWWRRISRRVRPGTPGSQSTAPPWETRSSWKRSNNGFAASRRNVRSWSKTAGSIPRNAQKADPGAGVSGPKPAS